MKAKQLTQERGTTHGDFATNAFVSQRLKEVLDTKRDKYTDVQKEALDMISMKLSRIASGHADFADHWEDIQGYAQLVLDEINSDTLEE